VEASGRMVPIYEPPAREPETVEKSGKLWLMWQERGFLWSVAWKTFLASAIIALLLPTHFEAVVKVVPGENSGGALGLMGRLAGPGAGNGLGMGLDAAALLGMKTPGAFYVEALKSRSVQDRIIERFDLRRHYWMLGDRYPRDTYNTRKKLKSFTDIQEDKKSGVIAVAVTDYDPQIAANIANAYIEELNKLAADLNTSDAHRERVFLEERLKQAKQDLDHASLALSQFSSRSTLMDPGTQNRAMVDAASRIQGEMIATEAELKGVEQIYSQDNVRVRTLRARLGELQGQYTKLMGNSGPPAAGGDAHEGVPSMRKLPLLNYEYADLYRQTKIQDSVYEFLTQQYELARIREAKELPTVRVMDRAAPPERKSGPFRTVIVILSTLFGMALAFCWVMGKNAWQQIPADDPRRMVAEDALRVLKRRLRRPSAT
jgi:capsule polysaccharide export protein KpsE/RkpR